MTDQHPRPQSGHDQEIDETLYLVAETETASIVGRVIADLLNRTSNVLSATVSTPEEPTVEWDHDSPCPSCGRADIRICRAKEEQWTYNEQRDALEYDGQSRDTAVLSGQTLFAFCPGCDAILATDPGEALIDWQTL